MNKSEIDHTRNQALKSAKSTDHVQAEYLNGNSEIYRVTSEINGYKLQFTIEDYRFWEFVNHDSMYDTIHDYFLDLESDVMLDSVIDNFNEIKSNSKLSEEDRQQLREYLREFYQIYESQMIKVAESHNLSLDKLFDKDCPYKQ